MPSQQVCFSRVFALSVLLFGHVGCGGKEDKTSETGGETTVETTDPTTEGPTTEATTGDPMTGPTTEPTTDPTTGPTTEEPTNATESDTSTWIVPPDMDGGGECSVTAQDCPDGQKCMPYANDGGGSWNSTKCVDLADNAGEIGDECTYEGGTLSGIDNCGGDSLCWFLDMEGVGECLEMCSGDPATCSSNKTCDISNGGVLALCLQSCDPTSPACDDSSEICFPGSEGGFICDFDGSPEDGGYAGDPCEFINVCKLGNLCGNAMAVPNCVGGIGCCAPFCSLDEDDPKQTCIDAYGAAEHDLGGSEVDCVPWYEPGSEVPGLGHVGICILP